MIASLPKEFSCDFVNPNGTMLQLAFWCVCVRACVRVCMCACVRVCVCACACAHVFPCGGVGACGMGRDLLLIIQLIEAPWPLSESDLAVPHQTFLRKNPNCCGWREFYKMVVWTLTACETPLAPQIHPPTHTSRLRRRQRAGQRPWASGPSFLTTSASPELWCGTARPI